MGICFPRGGNSEKPPKNVPPLPSLHTQQSNRYAIFCVSCLPASLPPVGTVVTKRHLIANVTDPAIPGGHRCYYYFSYYPSLFQAKLRYGMPILLATAAAAAAPVFMVSAFWQLLSEEGEEEGCVTKPAATDHDDNTTEAHCSFRNYVAAALTVLAQLGLEMKMESSADEGRVFFGGYIVISVLAITVGAPPPQIELNFWALGFISGGEEEEVTLPISWRIPVMNLQLRTMETLLLGLRFLSRR